MAIINGTEGNDTNLVGTTADDTINGLGGNDNLNGGLGNDVLDGGAGFDNGFFFTGSTITADLSITGPQNTGEGFDTLISIENLHGGGGNDTLSGDGGGNYFNGNAGDDVIAGRGGNDSLEGGQGNDTLDGGAGNDEAVFSYSGGVRVDLRVQGTAQDTGFGLDTLISIENVSGSSLGADEIDGDDGPNRLIGLGGDDIVRGNGGNDSLFGDAGNDVLQGGAGNDFLDGRAGDDVMAGGDGIDGADYFTAATLVRVDLRLQGARQDTLGHGIDTLTGIENLLGSNTARNEFDGDEGVNSLLAGGADDLLRGHGGADRLSGRGGADQLQGGAGNDTLDGGLGDDTLDGGDGIDQADYFNDGAVTVSLALSGAQDTGGSGLDTLVSVENLSGSNGFGDTLTGNDAANFINGQGGNDTAFGGLGNDNVNGGVGDDVLYGQAGNDSLAGDFEGAPGNDAIDGGDGFDTAAYFSVVNGVTVDLALSGAQNTVGAGVDTLVSIENLVGSNTGNDTLSGDASGNFMNGNGGDDVLSGRAGNDTLIGGAGADQLLGGDGNDGLTGGAGNDVYDGGTGIDRAFFNGSTVGVTVDLAAVGAQVTGEGTDTLIGIEEVQGSNLNDVIRGDAGANQLFGLGGSDQLYGGDNPVVGPRDTLLGGDGDDFSYGEAGDDYIEADFILAGNDYMDGGAGFDVAAYFSAGTAVTVDLAIQGVAQDTGRGLDTLVGIEAALGSQFNDTLLGGGANDSLIGSGGADLLRGGDGDDFLSGATDFGASNPLLSVVDLADVAEGGNGNDTLRGATGDDVLRGEAGDDNLRGDLGNDTLDGGAGSDFASYRFDDIGALVGVVFDLSATGVAGSVQQADGRGGTDTLIDIEIVGAFGTIFDDVLIGGQGPSQLGGNRGDDTLIGGGADDRLDGGDGFDTADYSTFAGALIVDFATSTVTGPGVDVLVSIERVLLGTGPATVLGTAGDDVLFGGAGNDTLNGGEGFDTASYTGASDLTVDLGAGTVSGQGSDTLISVEGVRLGAGNDFAVGSAAGDAIDGGAGNDTLLGLGGDDRVVGGAGNDVAGGQEGSDLIAGEAGDDTLFGNEGDDTVFGQTGDDQVFGGDGNDAIGGQEGNDRLDGGAGDDQVFGGDGADTALGQAGNDRLFGGDGDDVMGGQEGADTLFGEAGSDTLYGNEGGDTIFGMDGADAVFGGEGNDALGGQAGDDQIFGDEGDDVIFGNDGNDFLLGLDGNDVVRGGDGADALGGQAGNDLLFGGAGADQLYGGDGADTFRFDRINDSPFATPDFIFDWEAGVDRIDLYSVRQDVSDVLAVVQVDGGVLVGVDLGGDGSFELLIVLQGATSVLPGDIVF